MKTLLSKMLECYRLSHKGSDPKEIVVAPAALAALSLKKSVKVKVDGVPVVCRLFVPAESKPQGQGSRLGVFLKNTQEGLALRSCDIT